MKGVGWTVMPVLLHLYGCKWNEVVQGYLRALRPSVVRIVRDGVIKTDAITWRVTVSLTKDDRVESIEQEVEVDLPEGVRNGFDLDRVADALDRVE